MNWQTAGGKGKGYAVENGWTSEDKVHLQTTTTSSQSPNTVSVPTLKTMFASNCMDWIGHLETHLQFCDALGHLIQDFLEVGGIRAITCSLAADPCHGVT